MEGQGEGGGVVGSGVVDVPVEAESVSGMVLLGWVVMPGVIWEVLVAVAGWTTGSVQATGLVLSVPPAVVSEGLVVVAVLGPVAAGPLGWHMPAWQVEVPVHLLPQLPQFLGSAAVLTHFEPHRLGVAVRGKGRCSGADGCGKPFSYDAGQAACSPACTPPKVRQAAQAVRPSNMG